jgi:hypothetical protein
MFWIDRILIAVLVILIVLPFLSVYPTFDRFPYELLFSALGAASIVGLAWERIADSRRKRLYRLMKRVYLDNGHLKLHRTLESVCGDVRAWNIVGEEFREAIQKSVSTLQRLGRFSRVDDLYPKCVTEELRMLSRWVGEYLDDRKDFASRVGQFRKRLPGTSENLFWAIAKGEIELRTDGRQLVPYYRPSGMKAEGYAAPEGYYEKAITEFEEGLAKDSAFVLKHRNGTWRKEILERASLIRDRFIRFLVEHGIEPPLDFDKNWLEGGSVTVFSG